MQRYVFCIGLMLVLMLAGCGEDNEDKIDRIHGGWLLEEVDGEPVDYTAYFYYQTHGQVRLILYHYSFGFICADGWRYDADGDRVTYYDPNDAEDWEVWRIRFSDRNDTMTQTFLDSSDEEDQEDLGTDYVFSRALDAPDPDEVCEEESTRVVSPAQLIPHNLSD